MGNVSVQHGGEQQIVCGTGVWHTLLLAVRKEGCSSKFETLVTVLEVKG